MLMIFRLARVERAPLRGAQIFLCCLCLLSLFLAACEADPGTPTPQHQTVQTDSGDTISYSTRSQDMLIRIFFGGGKVGHLQLTPEISIYGDGTFITGPGLQPRKGTLSNDTLRQLLHTLTSTDDLLKLHRQVFNDIPDQNITLLQMTLNGKSYQFSYGPFSNLQESEEDMQEYQRLGNAISAIRKSLSGPTTAYTSQDKALLVYVTSRADFTGEEYDATPQWTVPGLKLADAAAYECGLIEPDPNSPRTNLDNGCLTYTVPQVAVLPDQQRLRQTTALLHGQPQSMFREDEAYYVVMLRPLLPDEIASQKLAMYGSVTQDYMPVPLKKGAIPAANAGS